MPHETVKRSDFGAKKVGVFAHSCVCVVEAQWGRKSLGFCKIDTWCARLVFVGVAVVVVVDHSWNACGAIQFVY